MSKYNLSLLNDILPPKYIFIACASFEKRCLSIPQIIHTSCISSSLIYYYDEFACYSSENREALKDIFGINNFIQVFNSHPILTADAMIKSIHDIINIYINPNIVLDITTFTREGLLIIFKIISEVKSKIHSLHIVYNSASTMAVGQLSFCEKEFRSVLGFSGLLSPLRKNHLVVLLGFEVERARLIINQYEPHLISFGIGGEDSSITKYLHSRNKEFLSELQSYYSNKPVTFTLSLVDPFAAYTNIKNHLLQYDEYNTIIAPMNTKLSTIGAAIYAHEFENTQLCYLQMDSYAYDDYSTPSDEFYHYKIY